MNTAHKYIAILSGQSLTAYIQSLFSGQAGFYLPLADTSGDLWGAGNLARNNLYTAGLGAELADNNAFATWATDNPSSWSIIGESGGDPEITERDPDQGHGDTVGDGGAANFYSSATAGSPILYQATKLTVGDTYLAVAEVSNFVAGGLYVSSNVGHSIAPLINSVGSWKRNYIAPATGLGLKVDGVTPTDITVNSYSVKKAGELDADLTALTIAQAGKLGANHAILYNGSSSLATIYNRASIQGMTEFSLWMLFNPSSAGEGSAGTFFIKADEFEFRFNSSSRDLYAKVDYSTTDAEATTSTALSTSAWQTVGLRIDNTSKQIDIFIDGVEASYASRVTGEGTRVSNTNNLIVGNNAGATQTLAGLVDEAVVIDTALTDNAWLQLSQLAGIA